jgi:adenylate cyclase
VAIEASWLRSVVALVTSCATTDRSQSQYEKAAKLFCRAAEVRPEDYQAIAIAGNMYDSLGDSANQLRCARETVERARRALDVNPKDPRAWILGAGALGKIDKKDEALEWAERSVSLSPESASTAYNYACMLAGFGEIERAIDKLEDAVRFGNRNKLYYETDCDFDPLRDHPRFKRLLESI